MIGLLCLCMLLALVSVAMYSSQHALLTRVKNGQKITMAEANANDTRVQMMAVAYGLALVVTAVFFMMWIHRAYKNLNSFPGERSKWTPGWAVGYYFIPFLNLVRGYQVMREIWDKSRPPRLMDRSAGIIGLWWGLWLAGSVISRVATASAGTNNDIDALLSQTVGMMIDHAYVILPGIVAVWMVWQIDRMQQESSMEPSLQTGPILGSDYV